MDIVLAMLPKDREVEYQALFNDSVFMRELSFALVFFPCSAFQIAHLPSVLVVGFIKVLSCEQFAVRVSHCRCTLTQIAEQRAKTTDS